MNGVLNVLKPPGMTSHDVVDWLRRLTGVQRIGHAGTLDPAAAGVLVLGLGQATRMMLHVQVEPKAYRADVQFGITTDSLDATGVVQEAHDASLLTESALEEALKAFVGDIEQLPPMASAVQVAGRRLHRAFREGKVLERPRRAVQVESLRLVSFAPGNRATAILDVVCSAGTYVRCLCADIGGHLGCGAHLRFLLRTAAGRYQVNEAFTLEELESAWRERGELPCESMGDSLSHMTTVSVSDEAALDLSQGRRAHAPSHLAVSESRTLVAALDERGRLVALARLENDNLRPAKVFTGNESSP